MIDEQQSNMEKVVSLIRKMQNDSQELETAIKFLDLENYPKSKGFKSIPPDISNSLSDLKKMLHELAESEFYFGL